MTRPCVLVLSSHSRYADGGLGGLRQHAGQLEVKVIDAYASEALVQVIAAATSTVILGAGYKDAHHSCSLSMLLESLPRLEIETRLPGRDKRVAPCR
jgi:hypothetical protein